MSGDDFMRRRAEIVRIGSGAWPFSWVWSLPAVLVAAGLALGFAPAAAFGIGLAAALSLSGSI
jgi:hypothetical protein